MQRPYKASSSGLVVVLWFDLLPGKFVVMCNEGCASWPMMAFNQRTGMIPQYRTLNVSRDSAVDRWFIFTGVWGG
jgi:hypothetical protein